MVSQVAAEPNGVVTHGAERRGSKSLVGRGGGHCQLGQRTETLVP